MISMENIIEKLIATKDFLPRKQQVLCQYIVENQARISVMTVAGLAENAHVGTTTVLRLAERFGFSNFNAFKQAILDTVISGSTSSYQEMKNAFLKNEEEDDNLLNEIAQKTTTGYRNFLIPANFNALQAAVARLTTAKNIYITGARSSGSLALYFYDALRIFMPNVHLLSFRRDYMYDRLFEMIPEDVLFVISAWPCTIDTISAARIAHKRGVPIVLLTNTKINPIAAIASVVIDTNSINNVCTPVLYMSAIVSLIQELGRKNIPRSSDAVEKLEKNLKENQLIVWEGDLETENNQ